MPKFRKYDENDEQARRLYEMLASGGEPVTDPEHPRVEPAEPVAPHPVITACDNWRRGIDEQDPVRATAAAALLVELLNTGYMRRPRIQDAFNNFRLANPLSHDNMRPLFQIVDAIREALAQ